MSTGKTKGDALRIRRVRADDMGRVIALDKRVTGVGKAAYWRDVFARYGQRRLRERFFLIAEPAKHGSAKELFGFIIG
jgi:hypothetical protein